MAETREKCCFCCFFTCVPEIWLSSTVNISKVSDQLPSREPGIVPDKRQAST